MGVGKTHIGRALAHEMGVEFYDSDQLIEDKASMSIPEVFKQFGEAKFRASEHKTIMETLGQGACILSVGGGALMDEATLEALKTRSTMIWIDSPLDMIWERIKDCKTRPLLQTKDPQKTLKDLLTARRPLYEQAHIHLLNDKEKTGHIIGEIIKLLSKHANRANV